MTDELSITGNPESMEILWDDLVYIVIREGYRGNDLICARYRLSTNEVEINQDNTSLLRLNESQIDEIKRRLIKYKDRIVEMDLKHEHLHVPVRMAE
jgi:hypothetical protein